MTSVAQSYSEKLKDPRWQKKRLEILQRDEWKCTTCGKSDQTLHVHHGYYEKRLSPWDYDSDTLHTLCETCHELADLLRVELQKEVARLPLYFQLRLIEFACLLNSVDDIGKDEFCTNAVSPADR